MSHGDELMKVLIHDGGVDTETTWALRVPSPPGRVFVRLDNVPFLHAKPTLGDVIEVVQDPAQPGFLSFDKAGRSYDEVCSALVEDSGRYAVIVTYTCEDSQRFGALAAWIREGGELHPEGAFGPRDGEPGTMYLAVEAHVEPDEVMARLDTNGFGYRFSLVHPV
ncbi:MAG: hypothetical protein KTR31_36285 [Myxococcales bacterium]|nr:hypothetical protein [Myxococcales bacterium]